MENEMDSVKMARGRWRIFYSTLLSNQRKILKIYLWFHAVAQSHTHELPREVSLYETEKERSNESVSREGSQKSVAAKFIFELHSL